MKAARASNRQFPYYIFFGYFAVLLLMSGIHTGFIVGMTEYQWPVLLQTVMPILYWALIAAGLTAYTRAAVRKNYDVPFQHISEAAAKVAKGDFSVRLVPVGRSETADYLNRLIEDFNKMAEELSGVETLRTDFIANVSHELKTPLSVMQNYATLLRQPGLSEEKRLEYAQAVADASRGMASLITNILKLNKLENQQIYPSVQTYDLGEQLCEALLGFEDAWEKKGLEIVTDIEEDVTVDADPELLALVWNNLFSNAVKFTDPGGTVSLRLKTEGDFAVVRVSDTGCGISPENGRHIFDKFYQGDTSHAAQGNGLGLALVKRVIDIVSGEISVESSVGRGSSFTVRLQRRTDGAA